MARSAWSSRLTLLLSLGAFPLNHLPNDGVTRDCGKRLAFPSDRGNHTRLPAWRKRTAASLYLSKSRRAMGERIPRVVIVGGGFGGLAAAKALRKTPAQIVLVDRTNHHLFQP